MKATDFKREHFEKGQSFRQADFDAYIAASDRLAKTTYTKYLPSMAGGLALSFLFAKGVGGFAGNMLAVLCIFLGLILGGVFNARAGRAVKECAAKLGVTGADVAAAKRHVKAGTVAWSGTPYETAEGSVPYAPDGDPYPGAQQETGFAPAQAPMRSAPALDENPMRALWASGLLVAMWFLLIAFQGLFGPGMLFNADALFFGAMALAGASAYLVTRAPLRLKLFGAGAGAIAAALSAWSLAVTQNTAVYIKNVGLWDLLSLHNMLFSRLLVRSLPGVALALCAAWLAARRVKAKDEKARLRLAAFAAAAVHLLYSLIYTFANLARTAGSTTPAGIVNSIFNALGDAAVLLLACMAIYALCNMPAKRVKLKGIGLVWAWLAVAGMLASLIMAIAASTWRDGGTIVYTAQSILAIAGLTGYILLLCKRRVGLYFILLGAGLMLGAQFSSAFTGVLFGAHQFAMPMASYAIGAVNPLFAYLAVRAGVDPAIDPAACAPTGEN